MLENLVTVTSTATFTGLSQGSWSRGVMLIGSEEQEADPFMEMENIFSTLSPIMSIFYRDTKQIDVIKFSPVL